MADTPRDNETPTPDTPDASTGQPSGVDSFPTYTETVVEYADNKWQRLVLASLLVLIFIALIGVGYLTFKRTASPESAAATANSGEMEWVRSIYGWGVKFDERLSAPTDVAIAGDGTIWALSGHDKIVGFNPDGTLKKLILPKGVGSIEGIDVAENGDLWVADYGGQVIQFKPNGKLVAQYRVDYPSEVDVRDGKIGVVAMQGVAVFTPDDQVLAKFGSRGQGPDKFDLPHGIVLGPNGNIYVADSQNRQVRAYTANGRQLWALGTLPDRSNTKDADMRNPERAKEQFSLPSGMTMNGKGQLVVVDPFKFNITVIDAQTGKVIRQPGKNGRPGKLAVYGDFGQDDGMFAYPTGIAYDKTRDWFAVADTANDRIQIVRIPNSGGVPFARVAGNFRWPMLILALPFIILLAALVVLAMGRKRKDDVRGESGSQPNLGDPAPQS